MTKSAKRPYRLRSNNAWYLWQITVQCPVEIISGTVLATSEQQARKKAFGNYWFSQDHPKINWWTAHFLDFCECCWAEKMTGPMQPNTELSNNQTLPISILPVTQIDRVYELEYERDCSGKSGIEKEEG